MRQVLIITVGSARRKIVMGLGGIKRFQFHLLYNPAILP